MDFATADGGNRAVNCQAGFTLKSRKFSETLANDETANP
jgi:hypothetical protein